MYIIVHICSIGSKGSGISTLRANQNHDYLAFVITNTYKKKKETDYQFEEAKKFRSDRLLLMNLFNRRNVKMIHLDDNSFDEIWKKVDEEVTALHPYKGVFIVFSGHGGENIVKDGENTYYIISGKTDEQYDTQEFIDEFNKKIGTSTIPTVFLIDACRGSKNLPFHKGQRNCLVAYSSGKGEKSHLPSKWIPALAIELAKGGDTIKNILDKANKECSGEWCHPEVEGLLLDDFTVDLGE